jgi:hypothetical protein
MIFSNSLFPARNGFCNRFLFFDKIFLNFKWNIYIFFFKGITSLTTIETYKGFNNKIFIY